MPSPHHPTAANTDAPFLRFPPFPSAPDGKTIIPFKDFKPLGIRRRTGEDVNDDTVECDGLGVPTIALTVKHSTDGQSKQPSPKNASDPTQPPKRKTWWEQWDELEDTRRHYYNPNATRVDRLYDAANDFRNDREWPHAASGLSNLWDQKFRLYIGLLHQAVKTRKKRGNADEGDDDDDDEDEEQTATKDTSVTVTQAPPPAEGDEGRPRKRKRLYRAIGSAYDELDADGADDNLTFQEKLANSLDEKDRKMERFLNNPEQSMKVFFSSFFRQRGLIWSEPRCTAFPHLVHFFLRFLIRCRVFPEPEYMEPLKAALAVVARARSELPATFVITRILYDDRFNNALEKFWAPPPTPWQFGDWTPKVELPEDLPPEFREATIIDTSTLPPPPADDEDGASGWGDGAQGQWGPPMDTTTAWTQPEPAPDWTGMDGVLPPVHEGVFAHLGPTALPLTHTPGVVEHSTRRIVSIHKPGSARSSGPPASAAAAVEEELGRRYGRVVLAPWPEWDKTTFPDIEKPVIMPESHGRVIDEAGDVSVWGEEDEGVSDWGKRRPHDPFKDNITLLVEPHCLEPLILHMGIGAKWVELARIEEGEEPAPVPALEAEEDAKKKGQNKNKVHRPRYWFMKDFVLMVTSFHTDKIED